MEIQAISPFDIVGDVTCVGPRWKRWRRSFEFYTASKGVTVDVQKRALLLHTADMAVQDLFETLSDPGLPGGNADDAASAYDVAMRTLDAHFSPNSQGILQKSGNKFLITRFFHQVVEKGSYF